MAERSSRSSADPSRSGRVLGWLALAAALAALVHATGRVFVSGWGAFSCVSWSRPDFCHTSAIPALVTIPFFLWAFQCGRARRWRNCGLWLTWGCFLFGLALLVPRGVFAPSWYGLLLAVLLVTCIFGAGPGLSQAVLAVCALMAAAWLDATNPAVSVSHVSDVWTQAGIAGSVIVSMALVGTLLHRTLTLAISAEEDQLLRMDEAKRALRHRENLLRHAMRVDTVGEVSSMVVHQLRNQFQLILGYAAVGLRSADPEVAGQFKAIVTTLGQSNELLENLLGMARREQGTAGVVDLGTLCEQACEAYRRVLPAQIDLLLTKPSEAVQVILDANGLEHALLNLVINARQAISGKGEIRIVLEKRGDKALLSVADTGSGIPEAVLGEIFKPFFTTKDKGKGTGLGLAAVQRFVLASNGEISVESNPADGSTFALQFPLVRERGVQAG